MIDFPGFHSLYDDDWIDFLFKIQKMIVVGIPAGRHVPVGLRPLRFAPPCETVGRHQSLRFRHGPP